MGKLFASSEEMLKLAQELREERERRIRAEGEAAGLRDRVLSLERQTESLLRALDQEREIGTRGTEALHNLVDKIVEMKREGFVPPPFTDRKNLETLDLDIEQPILDAIERRSQGDAGLYRQLVRWALQERRLESSVQDITQRILVGGEAEE